MVIYISERGPFKGLKIPASERGPLSVVSQSTLAADIGVGRPAKPVQIEADAELSAEWDALVEELDAEGLLARCDRSLVEMAARHAVLARRAYVETDPIVHPDRAGSTKTNPATRAWRQESQAFLAYARALGIGVGNRLRIPGRSDNLEGNPFDPSWIDTGS